MDFLAFSFLHFLTYFVSSSVIKSHLNKMAGSVSWGRWGSLDFGHGFEEQYTRPVPRRRRRSGQPNHPGQCVI